MEQEQERKEQKDFFISYRSHDLAWAEWIAWQLEDAGYSVILQAWDFRAGTSFIDNMDKAARQAKCTIAVLSPAYFTSDYTKVEWQTAFVKDPTGEKGLLIPVMVQSCDVEGLLSPRAYIDLVGLDEATARAKLLAGVAHVVSNDAKRAKPTTAPNFPGSPGSSSASGTSATAGTQTQQHTVSEPRTFPGTFPAVWNLPSRRNPFFVGREQQLARLHDQLTARTADLPQVQVISGLGGMGKTQTAIEYAYRYRHLYHYVLWVNAATTQTLTTSYLELAALLNLSEKEEKDQSLIIAAVKRWFLSHDSWLLIVDNADDLSTAYDFLPTGGNGHVLLTTRAYATGTLTEEITPIEKLDTPEALLLLLRRAKLLKGDESLDHLSTADRTTAEVIVKEMDGLPLALDQAGAYIEETQCSLSTYLQRYRTRQEDLLKRRGGTGKEHPNPVATTWSLSFEQVEQRDPLAADLLRACAFLAPDAIPEQLFIAGASELGPIFEPLSSDPALLDEAIATLLRYSFVKRQRDEQTITVHRLLQAVLRNSMNTTTQKSWVERMVRAINQVFPDVSDYRNWSTCQQYLPHAQMVLQLADNFQLELPEIGRLLDEMGYYLYYRAQYEQAEPLYQRAIAIGEKAPSPEHPDLADRLSNLAELYRAQGKYEQAEPLYQRAIAIDEKMLGPEHPRLATVLNNLAALYWSWGKYEQAEPLYQRAIAIAEKALGPEHPLLATYLNNLTNVYVTQGKEEQAEPLYQRAIAIDEKVLGPEHPSLAIRLNNLASLYWQQGKYELAEPLYQRAIAIGEKTLGPEHPSLATWLNNLALLYKAQGQYEQAEPLYLRAIAIGEKVLGPEHPELAKWLNNLANLYLYQGKYQQAEPLYQRAIAIDEKVLGPEHPNTKLFRENYAILLQEMNVKGKEQEP